MHRANLLKPLSLAVLALSACGSGANAASSHGGSPASPQRDRSAPRSAVAQSTPTGAAARRRAHAETHGRRLENWPEFGLNPQRSDATNAQTGITASNVRSLRHVTVQLPGTVDSSPIYVHGAEVRGRRRDVAVVTTSYGIALAIDASSGKILWRFTPSGYSSWAGTPQITNTSPLADPDGRFVYTASPDGVIHKLALADGREVTSAGWPARVSREPVREKMDSALNIDGGDLVVTTGGYTGDTPIYQGHVVLVSRASGRVESVFNTLCAGRHTIMVPSSCPQSDSAILSRGGAVIEPGGKRLLLDTGNGTWDGHEYFGDSVLELNVPGLSLRQAFTPTDQASLNAGDVDLGSSAPALIGDGLVLMAGKDATLRVLRLGALDGRPPGSPERLGGEVQTLPTPAQQMLFTAPAVWAHGGRRTVFVADNAATAAYTVQNGHLRLLWEDQIPGTSPILAGGLLYVYEPKTGGIEVYRPSSSHPIALLPGSPGHWNSPIVVYGHIVEPAGDANNHEESGSLELFSLH